MAAPRRPGAPRTLTHRETPRFRRAVALLARRLRRLRADREWTQEETAERIGVEPQYLRRLEAGSVNPSLAVLLSVAHAFGVDVGELVGEVRGPTDAG